MVRYIACFTFLVAYLFVVPMDAWQEWRGNLVSYSEEKVTTSSLCLCRYPWGCSLWIEYKRTVWETKQRCANGWEHNGNFICDKPICSPRCLNGGRCIEPNMCKCNDLARGTFCGTEICSRNHPCYPGDCYEDSKCNCTEGFDKTTTFPLPSDPGCMKIANNNKPFIGRSTTIISHIRNTREELLYFFQLDATDEDPQKRVVWSNQQVFNYLSFQFEARYVEPQTMPERPTYVHDFKYGIVGGKVEVKVFDFKKESAGQRGTYSFTCPGISVSNPTQLMNCSIPDKPFKTLIEHGDTMVVKLTAYSGGQRKIVLPDVNVRPESIIGTEYTKQMEFKFDFEPAVHCSKNSTFTCQYNANALKVTSEFTKTPIVLEWKGWVDTDNYSAGVGAYRLELHRLEVKDETLELTEANPTLPLMENRVIHTGNTMVQNLFSTTFTPPEPGLYSIVMEVTDNANNSIFTRRFALYDNVSSVTTNPLSVHGLHATSAAKETGYRWQMETKSVKLNWTDYFVNKVHHEKKFLNKIKKFPTLFDDLESIGIRNVKKFVFDSYDDTEGNRTMDAIPNVNGITRFEYGYVVNQASEQAPTVWNTGLTQNVDLPVSTNHGDTVTLWVRAFDILGNMLEKKTTVTIDVTPPHIISNLAENKTSSFTPNAGKTDGGYYYSSYEFYARDKESGVYQIELDVSITMADIGEVRRFQQVVNGSMDKTKSPSDPACVPSKDPVTCFLERQNVRLNNCWFLVPKMDYSITAGAIVTVRAFNQARQPVYTQFQIKRLNSLKGLEIYSGPENIRITNKRPDSFRIQWDLPTVRGCYNSQPIVINIAFFNGTRPNKYYLTSTTTFLYVAGLTPNAVYKISFYTQLGSETDVSKAFAQKYVQTDYCPVGSYSVNCSKQCYCREGPCDIFTGSCGHEECKDGWKGIACNESCSLGSFSENCSKQCHCRLGPCDGVTGACGNGDCKDGWTGIACNETDEDSKQSSTSIWIATTLGSCVLIVGFTTTACLCIRRKKRKRALNAVQQIELKTSDIPQELRDSNSGNYDVLPDDNNIDNSGNYDVLPDQISDDNSDHYDVLPVDGHDDFVVPYAVVPFDITEREATPMYTSPQQQMTDDYLHTGLRESSSMFSASSYVLGRIGESETSIQTQSAVTEYLDNAATSETKYMASEELIIVAKETTTNASGETQADYDEGEQNFKAETINTDAKQEKNEDSGETNYADLTLLENDTQGEKTEQLGSTEYVFVFK
ncbi:hypothetical protein DPMN_060057 [Dreissena polymorpha]|uniref:Uncharacterized protein n=1 Tax=Dreissena polymorpha TaxID=45954 RepID=A0A9D4HFI7_DREPO|nr:hypothetical protein DPMN_060057 [Dreissena polymorpha]